MPPNNQFALARWGKTSGFRSMTTIRSRDLVLQTMTYLPFDLVLQVYLE
jgi:hypothetical protein